MIVSGERRVCQGNYEKNFYSFSFLAILFKQTVFLQHFTENFFHAFVGLGNMPQFFPLRVPAHAGCAPLIQQPLCAPGAISRRFPGFSHPLRVGFPSAFPAACVSAHASLCAPMPGLSRFSAQKGACGYTAGAFKALALPPACAGGRAGVSSTHSAMDKIAPPGCRLASVPSPHPSRRSESIRMQCRHARLSGCRTPFTPHLRRP